MNDKQKELLERVFAEWWEDKEAVIREFCTSNEAEEETREFEEFKEETIAAFEEEE